MRLAVSDRVELEIVDDGCGLPPEIEAGVGLVSLRERAAVRMPGRGQHVNGFAAERIGHVDGLAARHRNAIAEMADMIDDEAFSHDA